MCVCVCAQSCVWWGTVAEEAAGGSGKVAEDSSWSSPASTRHNEMKACQGESSLGQGASTEKQLLVGAVGAGVYIKEYLLKTWLLTGSSWPLSGYNLGLQLQVLTFGLCFFFWPPILFSLQHSTLV